MTQAEHGAHDPLGERQDVVGSRAEPTVNARTLALGGIFIALFAFMAAVFAVALAARSIDEHKAVSALGSAGSTTAPTIGLAEFSVSPGEAEIPAGTSELVVQNNGSIQHNLTIEGEATPVIDGGDSATLDVSSLAPGTYKMYCSIPGHEAAGMKGSVTID